MQSNWIKSGIHITHMGSKSIETHGTENTNFIAETPSVEVVGGMVEEGAHKSL